MAESASSTRRSPTTVGLRRSIRRGPRRGVRHGIAPTWALVLVAWFAALASAASQLPFVPVATPEVDGIAAMAWGGNGAGVLGDGTTTTRTAPVLVSGFTDSVRQVSSGYWHSLGLLADGTVWAWGSNEVGELGDGTTVDRHLPVRVPLTDATQIAAGYGFSLALRSDGTVWGWGDDSAGELGDGNASDTPRLSPVQVSGLTGVTQISAGINFGLALLSDGTVRAWGENSWGQLGVRPISAYSAVPVTVTGLTGVTQVSAGATFGLALLADGTVRGWGENDTYQLGNGTTASGYLPATVTGLSGVSYVAGGWVQSLAVLSDGTVRSWGSNKNGELGDGTTTTRSVPTPVPGLSGVTQVAGGVFYSMAVLADGTVRGWGYNAGGELGIGTTESSLSPVPVPGLSHVTQVSLARHSLARVTVPAFSASLTQASGSVRAGDSISTQLSLTGLNGFTGSASLAATGLPAGVAASFSPAQVDAGGTATVTFTTSTSSPTGTSTVTVTATNNTVAAPVRSVTYQLTITPPPGFSISLSPPSGTVSAGGSVSTVLSLTPVGGFSGAATLAVSGLPTGVGASLSPSQVSAASPATLKLTTAPSSPTGTFPITVTATNTSVIDPVQTSTYQLTITAVPAFSISLGVSSATVAPGDSVATSVTLTASNGFTGSAALAATGLPSGVTASFAPGQVSAGSPATLTLSTSATSPPGDFQIAITATNASVADPTKTVTFVLTITSGLPQPGEH